MNQTGFERLRAALRAYDELSTRARRDYAKDIPTEWEDRRERVIAEARALVEKGEQE